MCGKAKSGKALWVRRTLRPRSAHCRIAEKSQQKQPTDRAAHCGLLSRPRSVGFCAPPLPALPSSRKDAMPRLPTKSHPRAVMQHRGTSEAAEPTGKARADRGDVAARRRGRSAITASAPLVKRGRTARRIAVRWPTGRAPRRQAARRSTVVWMSRDRPVQRSPIA